jgi:DNA invertase Pin-like site-specific DNA recombinase
MKPQSGIRVAMYARVSTQKQELAMQLTDLRKYCKRMGWPADEFLEKASSVKRRPVFDEMLKDARQGKYQIILVWRLDRFARSMRDFVNITLELKSWGVRLISATENVDSGNENPFAEFMMKLLGLLAELERKIIVARVTAGLAEAKRQGKVLGPPKRVFARGKAAKLREQGMSWRAIAAKLNVPMTTVRDALGAGGDRRKRGVRQSL